MPPRPTVINTLLRSSVRRPATTGRLSLPLQIVRRQTGPGIQDDFGGPGGQEPPPKAPSGANDVAKRNWPMITGVAFVLVAAFAYFGGGPSSKSDMTKQMEPTVRKGEDGLKKLEQQASNAVGELSGKKSGMGGFRAE